VNSNLTYFDISSNQVNGYLAFPINHTGTINYTVNLLSGDIPVVPWSRYSDVNILDGNLFSCQPSNYPPQDEFKRTYDCASEGFDTSLIIWGTFTGCTFVLLAICLLLATRNKSDLPTFLHGPYSLVQNVLTWRATLKDPVVMRSLPNTVIFSNVLSGICRIHVGISLLIIVMMAISYLIFNSVSSYMTISRQYQYAITGMYLVGDIPCTFLTILFIFCLTAVVINMKGIKLRTIEVNDTGTRDFLSLFSVLLKRLLVVVLLSAIDFVVIYSYVIGTGSNQFSFNTLGLLQISFAVYSAIYRNVFIPYMLLMLLSREIISERDNSFIFISSIAIVQCLVPITATFYASSECFNQYFSNAAFAHNEYTVNECSVYFTDGECLIYKDVVYSTDVALPFIYRLF